MFFIVIRSIYYHAENEQLLFVLVYCRIYGHYYLFVLQSTTVLICTFKTEYEVLVERTCGLELVYSTSSFNIKYQELALSTERC